MTQKEKRKYMHLAMRIIGLDVNEKGAAILVQVYEDVLTYKGSLNMKQITHIEEQMEYEYKKKDDV